MSLYKDDEYKWKLEKAQEYNYDLEMQRFLLEMAGSDEKEIKNRLAIMIAHMLKYQYQPTKQKNGWRSSIEINRLAIEVAFVHSQTLYNTYLAENYCQKMYPSALNLAVNETGMDKKEFPKEFPWDPEDVWTPDFMNDFLNQHYLPKPVYKKKKKKYRR